jgi:benzoate/toluate 1,2-dioxygenase alpha subunit
MQASEIADCFQVGADGLARLDRRVYTDRDIFEREMKDLWAKTWIYIAHESQLPKPNDFVTGYIGRQPVILARDRNGELKGFINACSHRGAKLVGSAKGNARAWTCPYHAWSFDTGGTLISVNGEATGAYPPSFDKQELGLKVVPRIESYRGFVFACLDHGVVSLEAHLGDAATFIDLLVDQSAAGWEVLKGHSSYTYDGNWKLQAENSVDGYHAPFVHANFSATIANRKRSMSQGQKVGMNLRHDPEKMDGGFFDLGRGHVAIWRDWDNPEDRFNYEDRDSIASRIGAVKARWAVGRLRNLFVFPNLMLMDQMSSQIRVLRPISVSKTEVTGYAIAPVGESRAKRWQRLRYFEDFFNPSGMATPDDLEIFNRSQAAFQDQDESWSDMSRGATTCVPGANAFAEELGIKPMVSGGWIQDEGPFLGIYRAWSDHLAGANQ